MIFLTALQAIERHGTKHSEIRKLRDEGQIPAVVYGRKMESKPISISSADFIKTIRENGRNGVISLQVNDENYSVMLHEIQKDPLKNEVIHADFQVVDMSQMVEVEVNVELVGEAPGVKDGGVLQQQLHQLSIRSLPGNIPASIEIDVSNLNVLDTVTIADVSTNGKYEINHEQSEVIASILPPRQEEEISTGEEQEAGIPENLEGRETKE